MMAANIEVLKIMSAQRNLHHTAHVAKSMCAYLAITWNYTEFYLL